MYTLLWPWQGWIEEEGVVGEAMVAEENIVGTIHAVDGDANRRHTFLYKLYEDAP